MAKRCSQGLMIGALLITTEQVATILNAWLQVQDHPEDEQQHTIRKTARDMKLPARYIEEVIDHAEKQVDRESFIASRVARALRCGISEVERGKMTPHARFVAYRDPTGKVDLDFYRFHRDRLEMLVGRELSTDADRQAARAEVEALGRLETVAA